MEFGAEGWCWGMAYGSLVVAMPQSVSMRMKVTNHDHE